MAVGRGRGVTIYRLDEVNEKLAAMPDFQRGLMLFAVASIYRNETFRTGLKHYPHCFSPQGEQAIDDFIDGKD